MSPLYTILWLIALFCSVQFVYATIGINLMVHMFQEGKRWWQFPLQMTALIVFAAVVLYHPF